MKSEESLTNNHEKQPENKAKIFKINTKENKIYLISRNPTEESTVKDEYEDENKDDENSPKIEEREEDAQGFDYEAELKDLLAGNISDNPFAFAENNKKRKTEESSIGANKDQKFTR